MLKRQALRLSLLPDAQQQVLLEKTAGCCRTIFNLGLDQRRWFARPGRRIGYAEQAAEIGVLKQAFPWFGEVPYHCLQQALLDLQQAYENLWNGLSGPPRPRKRGRDDSFRFPDPQQVLLSGNLTAPDKKRTRSLKHAVLKLPKIGAVRCTLHRAAPQGARVCNVTVSREADKWYAAIQLEWEEDVPASRAHEPVVGIDLGVAQPVVLGHADGTVEVLELPRMSEGDRAHLALLQQRVARKVKGSKNYRKAVKRLNAFYAALARRRRDAMEKITTHIAKHHGVVAVEDLQVKNMTTSAKGTLEEPGRNVAAKSGLNRSVLDVAPGALRLRLGQKLAGSGGVLLAVPAAHTSQRCNACGYTDAANRVNRDRFHCQECDHEDDADGNAACNIRDRARGLWGDPEKVRVVASTDLLVAAQAKPKRSFRKKPAQDKQTTGGLPAQACHGRGLCHAQGRKRVAATQPSVR